jgi:hypothetical protein
MALLSLIVYGIQQILPPVARFLNKFVKIPFDYTDPVIVSPWVPVVIFVVLLIFYLFVNSRRVFVDRFGILTIPGYRWSECEPNTYRFGRSIIGTKSRSKAMVRFHLGNIKEVHYPIGNAEIDSALGSRYALMFSPTFIDPKRMICFEFVDPLQRDISSTLDVGVIDKVYVSVKHTDKIADELNVLKNK